MILPCILMTIWCMNIIIWDYDIKYMWVSDRYFILPYKYHCHRLKLFLYTKKWHRRGVFEPLRALALVIPTLPEPPIIFYSALSLNYTLSTYIKKCNILAHQSRRLICWTDRIGSPPSYIIIHHSHSLNISETTGPIKVKFHMELLWDGGTKVCSNGPGHMTKMAAMPIHVYCKVTGVKVTGPSPL